MVRKIPRIRHETNLESGGGTLIVHPSLIKETVKVDAFAELLGYVYSTHDYKYGVLELHRRKRALEIALKQPEIYAEAIVTHMFMSKPQLKHRVDEGDLEEYRRFLTALVKYTAEAYAEGLDTETTYFEDEDIYITYEVNPSAATNTALEIGEEPLIALVEEFTTALELASKLYRSPIDRLIHTLTKTKMDPGRLEIGIDAKTIEIEVGRAKKDELSYTMFKKELQDERTVEFTLRDTALIDQITRNIVETDEHVIEQLLRDISSKITDEDIFAVRVKYDGIITREKVVESLQQVKKHMDEVGETTTLSGDGYKAYIFVNPLGGRSAT